MALTADVSSRARARSALERALRAAVLLIVFVFLARTSADADLWGHLAFGRDIATSGTVHHADTYSFTSDLQWVNHEWLAETVMWAAYAAGGGPGLVVLKLALVSIAGGLLLLTWRRAGIQGPARDGLLFTTLLGVWPLVATIRPQVFSVACFAWLLFVLERVHSGRRAWAWMLPAIFGVWVNVHGGWLVGAGVLVMAAGGELLRRDLGWRERAVVLGACAAAAAATLCNPYGLAMLQFLAQTVRPERGDVAEWRAVWQLPLAALGLWFLPTALGGLSIWRALRRAGGADARWTGRLPLPSVLIAATLCVGSFRVARLIGFFALAVAFALVPAGWFQRLSPEHMPSDRVRTARHRGWIWHARAAGAWVGLVVVSVTLTGREVRVDGPWFPEPEAALYVKGHGLAGRMLTWFDYGEYAIWHFAPAIRVSMDGRRETVYSARVRAIHTAAYSGGPDGLAAVARLAPDYVWLPSTSPALPGLTRGGWYTVFRGSRSTILSRTPGVPMRATAPPMPRAFPGP